MKKVFFKTNDKSGRQIVMFPYLGGSGASLFKLAKELDERSDCDIFVAFPPGHMGSEIELYNNLEDLLELYCTHVKDILKPNSIFFGHSMGGVIAYYLAKRLWEYVPELKPASIILSASPAPDFMFGKNLSTSDDAILLKEMERLGGTPEELLENRELLDYFLPIFRADYKILEDASKISPQSLNIPAEFILCYKDEMTQVKNLLQWKKYINEACMIRTMPEDAGHMYLTKYADLVADMICDYMNLKE